MKNRTSLQAPGERNRRSWKCLLLAIIVILAGLALYRGWGFTQKRSGTPQAAWMEVPVQVIPVVRKPLTYFIKVTGDILPLMQVDLFPKVSGYLERIDAHVGDRVSQGQLIAQIVERWRASRRKDSGGALQISG